MVTISLEQIKWVHYAGFFTVSQYVFLVLMVAMGPHPCPFPSPSPFSTKCRLLSSWPALVEKGEGGGEGAQLFLFAQNSVVGWHPNCLHLHSFLVNSVCQNMVLISFEGNRVGKCCPKFSCLPSCFSCLNGGHGAPPMPLPLPLPLFPPSAGC